jgi:group I intron endonuclease
MRSGLCGVYKIYCIGDGKSYVGSRKNVLFRLAYHKRTLKNNAHKNIYLQSAWNKYGENNFQFHILQECEFNTLIACEQFWMDSYGAFGKFGFNLCPKADRSEMSEETKKKIAVANFGYKPSKETCHKISLTKLGLHHSEESKKKIAVGGLGNKNGCGNKGNKLSEKHKKKTSATLTGRTLPEDHKNKIAISIQEWWVKRKQNQAAKAASL